MTGTAAWQGLDRIRSLDAPAVGQLLLQAAAVACLQRVLPARVAWSVEAVLIALPLPDVLARTRVSTSHVVGAA